MTGTQMGLRNMPSLQRTSAALDRPCQVQAKPSYRQHRGDDYAVSAALDGKGAGDLPVRANSPDELADVKLSNSSIKASFRRRSR
jgi:hypothetical protein